MIYSSPVAGMEAGPVAGMEAGPVAGMEAGPVAGRNPAVNNSRVPDCIPGGFLSCGLGRSTMGFVGFPINAILQWEQIH